MGGIAHTQFLIEGNKTGSDQIEDRVKEDPNDIDEVPIETDVLKRDMPVGSEKLLGHLELEAPEDQ